MENTSEFTSHIFLEKARFEMEDNAKIIREKNPEVLNHNYERAMNAVNNFYIGRKNKERRYPEWPKHPDELKDELTQKAVTFKEYFAENVFNQITHGSSVKLEADEDGKLWLKSTMTIATELGKDVDEIAKHQGPTDKLIGSREFVFANSKALLSRSGLNRENVYKIDSKDGFVLSMDIADQGSPTRIDEGKYADGVRIFFTSRNIFAIPQFEEYFSTYCASIFDTPEEAVSYLRRNYWSFLQGGVWRSDDEVAGAIHNPEDRETAQMMRRLYVVHGLIPPISPEWQFKDKVEVTSLKTD
jgi:hypothetical protein